jgi:hypothetical protein
MSRQYTKRDTTAVEIFNERLYIEADSGTLIVNVLFPCEDKSSECALWGPIFKGEEYDLLYILKKENRR